MGKVWDYMNYGMSKREWERKQAIEEAVKKMREKDFCSECGKRTEMLCQKKGFFGNCEAPLCSDCAEKCKYCGRHFCPKHIDNHDC